MKIQYEKGKTARGTGVQINLTGDDVARAIDAYLVANGVYVSGPRTIYVNGSLRKDGEVIVDPSGTVYTRRKKWEGPRVSY